MNNYKTLNFEKTSPKHHCAWKIKQGRDGRRKSEDTEADSTCNCKGTSLHIPPRLAGAPKARPMLMHIQWTLARPLILPLPLLVPAITLETRIKLFALVFDCEICFSDNRPAKLCSMLIGQPNHPRSRASVLFLLPCLILGSLRARSIYRRGDCPVFCTRMSLTVW